ncbi:LamG domain-containing protein [Luteolibacter sp. SL250]|uniref:LamG domain-containing protein n=1 Tax=Luteolibacter sp. SL250 TaxID=2995170 RepID=UPI00226FA0BB|nr:LamG domain-containing protein [Luteolibacter sp. SL250]WAC21583.1 LamG domain-containing protein [Luteolibacter sp. SL250]
MNTGVEDEFRSLMIRALEGGLDKKGMSRLTALCEEHPSLARKFGQQVEVDRFLEVALRNLTDRSGFSRSVIQRIGDEREDASPFVASVMGRVERVSRRRTRWFTAAVGLAALVVVWLGLSFYVSGTAATLHRGDSAKWLTPPAGESLRAGTRLKLESGLAEVHFGNGAEVILEGPADFEIRGRDEGFVHQGRVSVRIPEKAVRFNLGSPGGTVTDPGKAFGLHVARDGETEAEVFEGKIRVRPGDGEKAVTLVSNEKFISSGKVWWKGGGIDANAFVTSLPPQSPRIPEYAHWALDEGAGTATAARGKLIAGGPRAADLRNIGGLPDALPEWVDGPYGKALAFDGLGNALETHYPGVVGDAARTVAFWLRLPEDFDSEQGYGIISWGDLAEKGNAWQISVNPYVNEGPVGRLRVGIYPSLVAGSTDLRDGRWHHCAVVLYKDERNGNRIPALLYVDGKMEATASKGVFTRIHTSSEEGARPVWIARSLRHDEPKRSRGTGFFRGDLDEIYIFDGALNQRQIEDLMRFNTLFPKSY